MLAAPAWWNVGITSGWFISALIVITVGLVLLATLTWDVRRWRHLRRPVLLLLSQLMIALTIAAMINSQENFFVSVSDLVAALDPANNVGDAPVAPGVTISAVNSKTEHAELNAVIDQERAAENRKLGDGHGVVISVSIQGASTGYRLPAQIYLPGAYFERAEANRTFPVVELVDGFPGSAANWLQVMHLANALDQEISTGRMPPMVAVLPTQNPITGRDSECVDAVDGPRADTYLSQDVPQVVMSHFRVSNRREGWGIMGYSTGGFCAVNLALRHSDRYSAAVSLSGYFKPITDATTGDLYRRHRKVELANNPSHTVTQHRNRAPVHFYLFASRGDPHPYGDLQVFARKVRRPDSKMIADRSGGGHNFHTWELALPSILDWLGRTVQ